jgi:hypothetical protein
VSIIQNCERFKLPLFIVRSKADTHIENIMRDSGYDENDDNADDDFDSHQVRARQLLIDTTRHNLKTNLEKAKLANREVFIVSSSAIYSLITGKVNKKKTLPIDEAHLIDNVLKIAYAQRYGNQAPAKDHSNIIGARHTSIQTAKYF